MTCVILMTMGISLVSAATVKLPSFVSPGGGSWLERVKYVRPGNYEELFCTAEGNPKPIYKWFRNGDEIGNLGKNPALSINKTTGLLNVTKHYSELSDGLYQCMAYNSGGAAMTSPIQLSLAKMNTFPGPETIVAQNKAYETDYFSLRCTNEPLSVPKLTINWVRRRPPPNPNAEVKNTDFPKSNRVIVDPEGTLHFLWLERQDGGYEYLCTANNHILLTKTSNTDVQMVFVENRVISDRDPRSTYSKNVEVIAGEDATLTCIFTYYVANKNTKFEVKWYFGGSSVIGTGNDLILEKVKIPTADKSQEGEYRCEAWLGGVKKADATVHLKIKAPPQFLDGQNLTKLDVPFGGNAVFHCGAESYKSRTTLPTWMLNGEILYGCSQPYNFDCNERTGGDTNCLPRTENCEVACAEGMVPCNGTCVSSPAKNCGVFCEYPKFLCDDISKCLEKSQICDGRYDCKDGSDEKLCETGKDIVLNDGKFILNAIRSTLTVPNVSPDDNMCFQCIVTNDYGLTLFGSGCLTAIAGIKVTNGPNDVYSVKHGSFLNISVDAITDERYLNQLRFEWIMYVDAEDGLGRNGALNLTLPPHNTTLRQFFSLSDSGKKITIIIPKLHEEDEQSYDDFNSLINQKYAAVISHPYDKVVLNFTIAGKEVTKPAGIKVTNGPKDIYSVKHGSVLPIYVDAITGKRYLKQLRFEWIMYVDAEDGLGKNGALNLTLPPHNTALRQFFLLSDSGKKITIIIPKLCEEDEQSYDDYNSMINRKYAAVISHPYDKVVLNFTIEGKEVTKPVPIDVEKKGSSNLLIIALVLAIIVPFVAVILIVCYMYKNRGGTYPFPIDVEKKGSRNLLIIALVLAIIVPFVAVILIVCYMYKNRGGTYPLDRKEHQASYGPETPDVGRVEEDHYDNPQVGEASL